MTTATVIGALLCAALGGLLAWAYCAALWWNVRSYLGDAGWQALPLHLLRIAAVVSVFTLCARQGAMPLLASFAGFLAARTAIVARYRIATGEPG
jgi:F1F0 ATPase subunit 2